MDEPPLYTIYRGALLIRKPPPLGPPYANRHRSNAGSKGQKFSFKQQGTPATSTRARPPTQRQSSCDDRVLDGPASGRKGSKGLLGGKGSKSSRPPSLIPADSLLRGSSELALYPAALPTTPYPPLCLTPNTVELLPTLGALFPRGGPVQDPVLTPTVTHHPAALLLKHPTSMHTVQGYLAHKKPPPPRTLQ